MPTPGTLLYSLQNYIKYLLSFNPMPFTANCSLGFVSKVDNVSTYDILEYLRLMFRNKDTEYPEEILQCHSANQFCFRKVNKSNVSQRR